MIEAFQEVRKNPNSRNLYILTTETSPLSKDNKVSRKKRREEKDV